MIHAFPTPPLKAGELYLAGTIDFNVNMIKRQKMVIRKRYKRKSVIS